MIKSLFSVEMGIYMNWSMNMISPRDPAGADAYLRNHLDIVLRCVDTLLTRIDYRPRPIYRGVVLKKEVTELSYHPNFTAISFSEDAQVARHFADTSDQGFPSFFYLGDRGYVAHYTPRREEVLFHHKFFELLPYAELFRKKGFDSIEDLIAQREVCILQPPHALPVTPVELFDPQNYPYESIP